MKIAVVDDSIHDRKWLTSLFNAYSNRISYPIEIDFYSSGLQLLAHLRDKTYELIIMDIFMDDMDGIETAIPVQTIAETSLITFLTTSEDEIWRAVNTHSCFDYLHKKHFHQQRLEQLLDDVSKKLNIQEEELVFLNGKQEVKLPINDIQYIVANDKYTIIALSKHVHKYRITFSSICEHLEKNKHFILCNRGIMLNMDYIHRLDGDTFQMKDSTRHPIRRKGEKQIIKAFYNYQFQKLEHQKIF